MKRTRLVILIEVVMGTALGFLVSFCAWPFVAHAYGFDYSVTTNLGVTWIFTVLSIARGYIVRRFFARGMHEAAVTVGRRVAQWL